MAFGFPIELNLGGHRCVVVGELPVRHGKVEALLAGGATDVLVVAEAPADRLEAVAELDGVSVHRRSWTAGDLDGAFLAMVHDPDADARAAIARAARASGALVNVVDDNAACHFAMPALVRRGELTIAIGTGGTSPALARAIRERLEADFGPEWADAARVIGEVRRETLPLLPSFAERASRWRVALDLDEVAATARDGRTEDLRELLVKRLLDLDRSEVAS